MEKLIATRLAKWFPHVVLKDKSPFHPLASPPCTVSEFSKVAMYQGLFIEDPAALTRVMHFEHLMH